MQFAQLIHHGGETVLHLVVVEEISELLFLPRLTIGIEHPWRLIQYNILQILILFELADERSAFSTFLLPKRERPLGLRLLLDDIATEPVGIPGGSQ